MMVFALIPFAVFPWFGPDPALNISRSKTDSRRLECNHTTTHAALAERPGSIHPVKPRGAFIDRSVVICEGRMLRDGLRAPRDEAILSTLQKQTREFASMASSLWPGLSEKTWLVESYYPNAPIVSKISFATKNALMELGMTVSDRVPILAVGDINLITRMHPNEAYPTACHRYYARGSLREDDVLLGVVSRHSLETQLHAGICTAGNWTWLR